MATIAQLTAEPWWDREIVTAELDGLGDELVRRTGRPADAFGAKGNRVHLRGGHRSQEWIKNSAFCTSRSYTVQSGLTAEQLRHIAACDWTPGEWGTAANRQLMIAITKRVLAALRTGRLGGVTEVIGTLDGKTVHGERPDGSTFDADDSHLDHLHLTFDRRRLRDTALMATVADLITGDDMLDLTQPVPLDVNADGSDKNVPLRLWLRTVGIRTNYIGNVALQEMKATLTDIKALIAAAKDDSDESVQLSDAQLAALESGVAARLDAAIAALDIPTPAEIADAVADEQHARLES